mmetsp:Transcript_33297/g.94341  ORF Transcript_33297/g.94341 Transcript_33297/m.94341 type:complete len:238 (+) Transcript_33297:198-911(+)
MESCYSDRGSLSLPLLLLLVPSPSGALSGFKMPACSSESLICKACTRPVVLAESIADFTLPSSPPAFAGCCTTFSSALPARRGSASASSALAMPLLGFACWAPLEKPRALVLCFVCFLRFLKSPFVTIFWLAAVSFRRLNSSHILCTLASLIDTSWFQSSPAAPMTMMSRSSPSAEGCRNSAGGGMPAAFKPTRVRVSRPARPPKTANAAILMDLPEADFSSASITACGISSPLSLL